MNYACRSWPRACSAAASLLITYINLLLITRLLLSLKTETVTGKQTVLVSQKDCSTHKAPDQEVPYATEQSQSRWWKDTSEELKLWKSDWFDIIIALLLSGGEGTYIWKLRICFPVGEEPIGAQIVFKAPAGNRCSNTVSHTGMSALLLFRETLQKSIQTPLNWGTQVLCAICARKKSCIS